SAARICWWRSTASLPCPSPDEVNPRRGEKVLQRVAADRLVQRAKDLVVEELADLRDQVRGARGPEPPFDQDQKHEYREVLRDAVEPEVVARARDDHRGDAEGLERGEPEQRRARC